METLSSGAQLDIADGAATITLNRPHVGNALDLPALDLLRAHVDTLAARADVRIVVLRGAGSHFCTGADLHAIAQAADRQQEVRRLADAMHDIILTLRRLDAPVLAVVRGAAAGGGLGLAINADLCIAAHDASFVMAFPQIGLSPDSGSTWLLPRLIGTRAATELMLTGGTIDAPQAAQMRLINRAVPADQLEATTAEITAQILRGSAQANSATKRLIQTSDQTTFADQLVLEAASVAQLAGTSDGQGRTDAFLSRRLAVSGTTRRAAET